MSEKLSEFSERSDCVKAAKLIRKVALTGTQTERIGEAARTLKWPWSRAKNVWYQDARRIDAHEMDALRAAIRRREMKEASREYRELTARIERLETALAVAHPTLDRDTLDAVLQAVRGPRGVDRAGTDRDGEG